MEILKKGGKQPEKSTFICGDNEISEEELDGISGGAEKDNINHYQAFQQRYVILNENMPCINGKWEALETIATMNLERCCKTCRNKYKFPEGTIFKGSFCSAEPEVKQMIINVFLNY